MLYRVIFGGLVLLLVSCDIPLNHNRWISNSVKEVDSKIDSLQLLLLDSSLSKESREEIHNNRQHLLEEREFMLQYYVREYRSDTNVYIINSRKSYWTRERVEELFNMLPEDQKNSPEGKSIIRFLKEYPTAQPDSVSIWIYDHNTNVPIRNKEVNVDTLTPPGVIDFINRNIRGEKIHLDLVKIANDTIYVKIKNSTYLTQQMGTTGADEYMSTTTFTLTELKGIKYVNFNFEEGDHAVPGTYSQERYLNRNK